MTVEEKLKVAVGKAVGGAARRIAVSVVVETFRGQTVWEGAVSTYATHMGDVYAWVVDADPEPQYVTVQSTDKITTPIHAVRAWIVSAHRK